MEDNERNLLIHTQNSGNNVINENRNEFENDDEDPLGSVSGLIEPSYYKLERVVFAEPIEPTMAMNNEEPDPQEDSGEITFIENVMVKKQTGKRNKYFIDIKEGCLNCPLTECTKSFASTALAKAHVRKVHGATTRCICERCGAAFAAMYLLRRHYAVHSGRRVQCDQCGVWLSERTSLSAHRRTHGAHRPHACVACRRAFLRRSSLRAHCAFVHALGEIACGSCDARFTSRKQWSLHRATHKK